MKIKNIYLFFFIIGIIVPYWELINFFIENSFDFILLFEQLTTNRISRFFAYDVIISAFVLFTFIYREKHTVKKYWLPIFITLIVGVSAGLPLFLYQREKRKVPK